MANINDPMEGQIENDDINYICSEIGRYRELKNYPKMVEFCKRGIEKGNVRCMNDLGFYYFETKEIDLMIETYQMGIDKKSVDCMINLAYYYNSIADYPSMLKYNKMALATINTKQYDPNVLNEEQVRERYHIVCSNLSAYYKHINDEGNMILCYKLCIQKGNTVAAFALALHYQLKNDIDNMKYYYDMCIEKASDTAAMINMAAYYYNAGQIDEAIRYYMMVIDSNQWSCSENMMLAMAGLGDSYYFYKKDNDNARVYYIMGANRYQNARCIIQMARIGVQNKDINDCIRYYKMFLSIFYDPDIMIEYFISLSTIVHYFKDIDAMNELMYIYKEKVLREFYFNFMNIRIINGLNPGISQNCQKCNNHELEKTVFVLCQHRYCIDCLIDMIENEIFHCCSCSAFLC